MAQLLLDLSRLFARADLAAPTGIDRVERAYLNWALKRDDTAFLIRIPGRDVIASAADIDAALQAEKTGWIAQMAGMTAPQARLARVWRRIKLKPGFTYLNVGHSNLKPRVLDMLAERGMGRFVAMVHDTIPLDMPQLCRADQLSASRARMELLSARSNDIIAISNHSAARFAHHARAFGRLPALSVLSPGIEPASCWSPATEPYFVAVGTIEPRKNIELLLDVWEDIVIKSPKPTLHIVGRRGWERQEVMRRLNALTGTEVIEHQAMDDQRLNALLKGARALLFPTLAEGFGIPLYEARSMGLPVIASDLPVLREHGTAGTRYVPVNDKAAWGAAIQDAVAIRSNEASPCARVSKAPPRTVFCCSAPCATRRRACRFS